MKAAWTAARAQQSEVQPVPIIGMTANFNVVVRGKPLLPRHGRPQACCFCHGGATGQEPRPSGEGLCGVREIC